jgi:hypothetical protein
MILGQQRAKDPPVIGEVVPILTVAVGLGAVPSTRFGTQRLVLE